MSSKSGSSKLSGKLLIGLITSVCSSGFLLFGYDQGVMSGVVVSDIWLKQMGNPSDLMVGTITALYDVGAAAGAISAAFTAEPLGRKRTLILGSLILCIGSIIMSASYERIQFMVSRVITGVGIGYITSVTPVYQSEISSTAQRGWQVCCQLTTMLFGLMLAYWINYGFSFHDNSSQWRFPLAFQCLFAIYIISMTAFLPDTPRWLMRHDPTSDRGVTVLAKLRDKPPSDGVVQRETNAILDAISLESKVEGTWSDLFKSNGVAANKRFYLALGIQFMQQMTGINIVTYYAPTLYQNSLGMSSQESLFLGCFTQLWYVLASFLTWYTIDRVGRRRLFIINAIGMCLVLVVEAICVENGSTGASIVAVVMVFMFEAFFTWGWMAGVWVYAPEVLPLNIRAKGAALAAAADFLGNFLVVEVTPVGIANIGWKFYLVWAVLNLVNATIVWAVYPETGGLQLEHVDRLFIDSGSSSDYPIKKNKLQWSVVGKSIAAVKLAKTKGDAEYSDGSDESIKSRRGADHIEDPAK